MKTIIKFSLLSLIMAATASLVTIASAQEQTNSLTLWYRQPAGKDWNAALPIGNGRLGAMVYGNLDRERLQLNEDTVWEGYKRDGANPDGLKALPEIRKLLLEGKNEEASNLAAK